MRAFEFLNEDPIIKQRVIRSLGKKPDEDPIFRQVYKVLVGEPISSRIKNYVQARGDKDALAAVDYLDKIIPTLGDANEVKQFLADFKKSEYDLIDIKQLCPADGMTKVSQLSDIVTNQFGKKLFDSIHDGYKGKNDAGPGEAALAILSPNITYAQGATTDEYGRGGDIIVKGIGKVEVKGGAGGRLVSAQGIDQKGMTAALGSFQLTKPVGKKALKAQQAQPTPQTISQPTQQATPAPTQNTQTEATETAAAGISATRLSKPMPEGFPAEEFMRAACQAWFGKEKSELISAVGKPEFRRLWVNAMYESYQQYAGWTGILFINKGSYQYTVSGNQIPDNNIANWGYVYYPKSKQPRDMAPQILPS
jgi:hypothetical protein